MDSDGPNPPEPPHDPNGLHQHAPERPNRHTVQWWTLSIILHVGVFVALVFPTVRHFLLKGSESETAEARFDPELARSLADDMLASARKKILHRVRELHEILDEMAEIRAQKRRQLIARFPAAEEQFERISWTEPSGVPDPHRLDAAGAYAAAAAAETQINKVYRDLRMVELARIQQVSLTEADQNTRLSRPVRPPADVSTLEGPVDTLENFKRFRSELIRMRAEVNAMVTASRRLLDLARGLAAPDLEGVQVTWRNSGTLITPGGSGYVQGSDAGPPLLATEFFPGGKSSELREWFKPLGTRRIDADGRKAKWLFIDTWHIIGPFENPNRANLDKKFPPETVVDLDATYIGKQDIRLRWDYVRASGIPITPPVPDKYSIWYAYTEIYSDREAEYWFAFGSDDYGKCWVNGKLVWTSGKSPHAYIPDRGYRKVSLRKGANRVLFKLENAGGTTGFSAVIFLESAEQ